MDVKMETIQICQSILPRDQNKLAEAIDIVHRLGKRKPGVSKPRGVILCFLSRTYWDAVWATVKNSSLLCEKGLRFAEDLPHSVKEIRAKLWPAIQKACNEVKLTYFVWVRAFISGVELHLQQIEEHQLNATGDEDQMT